MTVQVFIPSKEVPSRKPLIILSRAKRAWVIASCKLAAPMFVYIRWCLPWRHTVIFTSRRIFLFLGSKTRAQFMLNSWRAREMLMCLFIVCETVFTIGESRAVSMQMTQDSKLNKWLEIVAGEDFPPKLLWRTSTKIHRERRTRRQHC